MPLDIRVVILRLRKTHISTKTSMKQPVSLSVPLMFWHANHLMVDVEHETNIFVIPFTDCGVDKESTILRLRNRGSQESAWPPFLEFGWCSFVIHVLEALPQHLSVSYNSLLLE